MKVVILAGGLPSNISEEHDLVPKPMVNIGERPLIWHIMKLYSYYGYNDFIICAGYKSDIIKQYFLNYYIYSSDITIDLKNNNIEIHNNISEPWNVTVIDTGLNSSTADRIKLVKEYIDDENFIVCYGDCLSNININKLVEKHTLNKSILTLAIAKPTGRNLTLNIGEYGEITSEENKNIAWVNSCNLVVNKDIFHYLKVPHERFELETINRIAEKEKVDTFEHNGFWSPVETVRDKIIMQNMWDQGNPPWRIWKD
ncbi:glycosyltransferase family protein [Clostridium butyricum]|uniref:sugar phosphate nucleotidyltransferase n=1 Tax=Clostridium butyricum TaxID=1492 RepID=UPI002107873D|nr:sugar phosphate nucleotidyltransferase [Clostridium butyricum]MCQ2014186.1 glucose-1-phosphate cytidylyltransferase [Clostridium butyricum]MCQ2026276.1 glucose-1-phosphate cytidylyltransferase [Clostridium butyricum]